MAINKPPPDDPKQSARFVETAKAAGATSGSMFARAFKKIIKPKGRRSRPSAKKGSS